MINKTSKTNFFSIHTNDKRFSNIHFTNPGVLDAHLNELFHLFSCLGLHRLSCPRFLGKQDILFDAIIAGNLQANWFDNKVQPECPEWTPIEVPETRNSHGVVSVLGQQSKEIESYTEVNLS
jgi:hypothetical protein